MADDNIKTYQAKKGIVIKINRTKCLSCGACVAAAPNTFLLDEEMVCVVNEESMDEQEVINEAASYCPDQAISVIPTSSSRETSKRS